MRYTKFALLAFGAGLLLGLVVVIAEIHTLSRVASGLMAVGLIGIPIGMMIDWRRATKSMPKPAKRPAKPPIRRGAAAPRRARRSRKQAIPKR
jgi:hypothetical protein